MADAAENKAAIEKLDQEFRKLQTENIDLKATVAKRKLPAKSPSVFKYGDSNFDEFTKSLRNYLITMGVLEKHHVQVLLTYICNKSYALVTRVFPAYELVTVDYWKACQNIAKIVTQNINPIDATVKMLNVKQSYMNTQEFISKIENYAKIAFPSKEDDNARDKCMTASLLANLKNQNIKLELQKFQKADAEKPPSFAANTLKLMELEQMMGCPVEDDEESSLAILNLSTDKIKTCHICASPEHLKYQCPQNTYSKNNTFANNVFPCTNFSQDHNNSFDNFHSNDKQFYGNNFRNNYSNNYRNNYRNGYHNNYRNNYANNHHNNDHNNFDNNDHNNFHNNQSQNFRNFDNFNNSYKMQNENYNYQQNLLPNSHAKPQFENNAEISENDPGPSAAVNEVDFDF